MDFTPMSQEEIEREDRAKPGLYGFKVEECLEKMSKAGNPMIELKLIIYTDSGLEITIYDYLVSSVSWKLKQFCKSVGLIQQLMMGKISEMDILNKTGICDVAYEKNDNGEFLKVKKYLEKKSSDNPSSSGNAFEDDDLPF